MFSREQHMIISQFSLRRGWRGEHHIPTDLLRLYCFYLGADKKHFFNKNCVNYDKSMPFGGVVLQRHLVKSARLPIQKSKMAAIFQDGRQLGLQKLVFFIKLFVFPRFKLLTVTAARDPMSGQVSCIESDSHSFRSLVPPHIVFLMLKNNSRLFNVPQRTNMSWPRGPHRGHSVGTPALEEWIGSG